MSNNVLSKTHHLLRSLLIVSLLLTLWFHKWGAQKGQEAVSQWLAVFILQVKFHHLGCCLTLDQN